MKSVFILIAITWSCLSLKAQNCNTEVSIDEFTNTKSIKTPTQTVSNTYSSEKIECLDFSITKIDSVKLLAVIYNRRVYQGSMSFCFNGSSSVMLKLDNGKVITLNNSSSKISCAKSEITANEYGVNTYYSIVGLFVIPEDIIEDLKASTLSKVRINFTEGHEDIEIRENIKCSILGYKPRGDKNIEPFYYFIDNLKCL
jgi:hypothetical protein